MGSQESVDIFLKIDKAWKERDYDAIKSLVSKDAEFVNEKGEVFVGPQAFADYIEKDYQESLAKKLEWGWTINYVSLQNQPTQTEENMLMLDLLVPQEFLKNGTKLQMEN